MMRVCLLLFLFLLARSTVVDVYPTSWTATNHVFTSQSLDLNGYTTITVESSTFTDTIMNITNCAALSITNSIFQGKYANETSQIIGRTITTQTYQNNTFRGTTVQNGYYCVDMNTEILYIPAGGETITLTNNRFEYTGYPSLPFVIRGNKTSITSIRIASSQITVDQSGTDLYSYTGGVTKCIPSRTTLLDTLDAVNTDEAMFKIVASNVATMTISNNTALFYSGNTTKLPFSATTWMFDSMFHFYGLGSSSAITYTNNTIQTVINGVQSLEAPVRVQRLMTNMTTSSIKTAHGLSSLTPRFQYLANALISQNGVAGGAYTHDIQMEPDYTDEFAGYNPCHYACKNNCTSCLFVDENQHAMEFSTYTHGVCFQRQVFSKMIHAARLCGHEKTYITTPYRSNDALVFSTKNKENGKSELLPRTVGGSVIFVVNGTINSLPEYRQILDHTKYASDPEDNFWNFYKPFLIIPREYWGPLNMSLTISSAENAVLTELKFTNIVFSVKNDDTPMNTLFSTVVNDYALNGASVHLSRLELDNSPVQGYSLTGLFNAGGYFLNTLTTTSGRGSVLGGLDVLSIHDGTYTFMDQLFDSPSLNVSTVYLANLNMDNTGNGLIDSTQIQTLYMGDITSTYSRNAAASGKFIRAFGRALGNSSVTMHNVFISLDPLTSGGTTATGYLELRQWNVSDILNVTTDSTYGIGLQFSDLTQYPCNFFSFVALENRNPNLNGNVYDFHCGAIFCKELTCFQDSSLTPEYCEVNATYSIIDPLYRIKYFLGIQQALTNCIALSPRRIYITQGAYEEYGLVISNKNAFEDLQLLGLGQPIIVGADHSVQAISNTKFNLTVNGIDFVNPTGLTSYTDTFNDNILYCGDTAKLYNFTLINSSVYAQQLLTNLTTLPQGYSEWRTYLDSSTTETSIIPYVRSANVYQAFNLALYGPTHVENVRLYGSHFAGFNEYKAIATKEISHFKNVTGHNHFATFISSTGYDVVMNGSFCYTCGGLSTAYIVFSVYKVSFWTGRRFVFENVIADTAENVTGNPFFSTRFPYGNPYKNGFNADIGYLVGLWVSGGSGTEWVEWKIRMNQIRHYPWVVRIENVDSAVQALNNEDILRLDDQSEPRQIQHMNDKTNSIYSMHGLHGDIIFGNPSTDTSPPNSCTGLCMPDPATLFCSVSTTFTSLDSQHYHSLQTAIIACPYRRIFVLDSILYENITTNFVYSSRASLDLEIIGYGQIQIVGFHEFIQDCTGSDNVPTEIIWRDITFKNSNNMTTAQPIIDLIPSNSLCFVPILTFINTKFLRSSLPLIWTNSTVIRCNECNVRNITIDGATFGNGFAVHLDVNSIQTYVYLLNSILTTPTMNSFVYRNIRGFNLTLNTFTCGVATRCGDIYGSTLLIDHVFDRNIITSDTQASSTRYTGIYWDLDQSLDFAAIDTITTQFTSNVGFSSRYGIWIVSTDLESYFPCLSSDNQYVRNLQNRNPLWRGGVKHIILTGRTSLIEDAVLAGAVNSRCASSTDVSVSLIASYWIYIAMIFIVILVCYGYFILCAQGARISMDRLGWRRERNMDKITITQNRGRMQTLRDKIKNIIGF